MARMTNAEIEAQLNDLIGIVAHHPSGITRAALGEMYASGSRAISERMLQRRLERLVGAGRLQQTGAARSATYLSATQSSEVSPGQDEEGHLPTSAKGSKIRTLVRRPMVERSPAGYDATWLHRYTPGQTWYLPKKLRSKLHESGRTPDANQPAGTYARQIFNRLLIDLAWASSRLEGNTYTRLETQNLLEFGQRAEGRDAEETQMLLNHKSAIEFLVTDAEETGFNRQTIRALHAALSENLVGDPADEGRLRGRPVNITGTSYNPSGVPLLIEECFDQILLKASAIPDPFEQAFFAMVHIPYLQPFVDVNKRTSRLAANLPLVRANLCPMSFVDVPHSAYIEGLLGIYELKRVELLRDVFEWGYERSCERYRVIRDSLAQPDAMRLRYRNELSAVVAETVRSGAAPRTESLRNWAADHDIRHDDRDGFAERALALLVNLHEGSASRYGLRPSEFHTWKAKFEQ